jgi:beta-glucosidase/6-phospho-beta-glucosidase/beta-galactosidase
MMMIRHPSDALPSYKAGTRIELTSSSSSSSNNHAVTSYDVFFDQIQVSDIHPVGIVDNHFRLPLSLKDSVTHMAPTFKMLTRNDYDFMSDKTMPVGE